MGACEPLGGGGWLWGAPAFTLPVASPAAVREISGIERFSICSIEDSFYSLGLPRGYPDGDATGGPWSQIIRWGTPRVSQRNMGSGFLRNTTAKC